MSKSKKSDDFAQGVAWTGAIAGALLGLGAADGDPEMTAATGLIVGAIVGGIGGAIFAAVVSIALRLIAISVSILITLYRLGILQGLAS